MGQLITSVMPRPFIITREGWPFIGVAIIIALVGAQFHLPLVQGAGVVLALACAAFFRNPQRRIPTTPGAIVSPADGRVVAIDTADEPFFGCGRMQRVSIFLSVADVHINRCPVAGVVEKTAYIPGRFVVAYAPHAPSINERHAIWIKGESGQEVVMVQIAGKVARRIVSYVRSGDRVDRGMRCGMIRFGSRVDLYVPLQCAVNVRVGEHIRGGTTTVASFAQAQTKSPQHDPAPKQGQGRVHG